MKQMSTRKLTLCAMFVALQVVLSKFLMLQLTPAIRLSIDAVPILLSGVWFGPLAGALVGTLADLTGTLLFPTAGAYYPPLTVAFLLLGLTAGLLGRFVKEKPSFPNALLAVVPAEIVGSLLWKSLALSWLTGATFPTLLSARALPVLAVCAADVLLVFAIHRLAGPQVLSQKEPNRESASDIEETAMTYEEALNYIHHVTWRGSRLGLDRTRELLVRMGRPDRSLRFIHVAGTNGKGSTCAMLASVLQSAGYKTGLYTSPFIDRFNERMAINGEPISDDELAALTALIRPQADGMADHPTEFELITVLAMAYFARHSCDVVVLEVGMGGELDSTNVIDTPELAVIANIGLDHTRELGPTLTDIAGAKAGIIKENGDVVIYGQNPEADAVFTQACAQRHARLTVTDHSRIRNVRADLAALTFDWNGWQNLTCHLVGSYQKNNAALALTALEVLGQKGWHIDEAAVRAGLATVKWPARFEVLRRNPLFVADGGHNPQGVAAAVESLQLLLPGVKPVFLLGIMADKDAGHMLSQIVPLCSCAVTVAPNNPRAMAAETLAERMQALGVTAEPCASVREGVKRALELAGPSGTVCALGSLYMLGDVRACLKEIESETK